MFPGGGGAARSLADDQRPGVAREDFIPTVQKRGAAIIDARGAVLGGERRQRRDRPRARLGAGTRDGDWVCMGVPSDGSYGIPEGVIYGYPVTSKGGEYQIVKGIEISDFSREAHGRHAEGAARRARRREAPAGQMRRLWSPDAVPRTQLETGKPLQVVGTICAYHALMAKRVGYRAIYLSGGGVAAGSLGMPDLGISNLDDVLIDIRRITDVCDLPLLVDVDTGFGASAFNVARTTRSIAKAGAAAMHIEDQVGAKRCGHRPGRSWSRRKRCATGSRPRSTRAATRASSSWRAPTRWPAKVWTPRFARSCLRGSRSGHDLPRGHHGARHVPQVRRRGEGAGPRQHHRVRQTPLFTARSCARPASRSRCIRCRHSGP